MNSHQGLAIREEVEAFMHGLEKRNPGELEFHQAVREVDRIVDAIRLGASEVQGCTNPRAFDGAGSNHHLSCDLGG